MSCRSASITDGACGMDSFERRIDAFLRRRALLETGEPVAVGLSGGVDSMVLTSVLAGLGMSVRAVHVNYRLRGDASDEDEAFVRNWCGEQGIDLIVRSFDGEWPSGASVQQAARDFRYAVFEEAALEISCGKVAVGHHRGDQAETVLLNLFRGSGPEGLAGMSARREIAPGSSVQVVRPLLAERRRDIASYARAKGLTWREDTSNTASKYRRSALREHILPLIEQHFGEAVVENIARSGALVREYVDEVLREELESCFDAALTGEGVVDEAAVRALPPVLRRRVFIEALRRWAPGFEADARAAARIEHLLDRQPGRRLVFGNIVVWRERERIVFTPSGSSAKAASACRLDEEGALEIPGGYLHVERLGAPPGNVAAGAPEEVYLDARTARFPLLVRPWEAGDRFVPLGMRRGKKISDFLTDEQVPPHRKRAVRVVESEGRIVWVLPLRISEEARVRDDSSEVVRLRFTRNRESSNL